ncbi:carbohydrate kinase family protein [Candidatus Nomurabacteria bacterium]|nr:carbohydrate kinase family protein [Candidatus Nomurabacteria bacterium]USN94924.1 MAG: carbohydrate kinase family protein [Candidatus Nomurabacteria bacterium]
MGIFSKKIDFLAIGDNVTDAFIKISDAKTHCKLDQTNCELCVRFGDKVPFDDLIVVPAVGNGPNAAVAAARLGLSSALSAAMGKDTYGKECLEALKKNEVITDYIDIDPKLPTNYHFILWYDVERTILVKHQAYVRKLNPKMPKPRYIYLTSLGENTLDFHNEIADYLEKNQDIFLAFQPGTFQMKMGIEKLGRIYSRSNLFFCNVEEAQRILGEESRDVSMLLDKIHNLGPKNVVITDGIEGAYAREENGKKFFVPVYPHEPFERTGAGDAFASTVTAYLAMGLTFEEALIRGPINSMSVVQKIGAQEGLLPKKDLEDYLAKAPSDYKIKEI